MLINRRNRDFFAVCFYIRLFYVSFTELLCKPYEVVFVHCKAHIRSSVNFIAYILLVPFENMCNAKNCLCLKPYARWCSG